MIGEKKKELKEEKSRARGEQATPLPAGGIRRGELTVDAVSESQKIVIWKRSFLSPEPLCGIGLAAAGLFVSGGAQVIIARQGRSASAGRRGGDWLRKCGARYYRCGQRFSCGGFGARVVRVA